MTKPFEPTSVSLLSYLLEDLSNRRADYDSEKTSDEFRLGFDTAVTTVKEAFEVVTVLKEAEELFKDAGCRPQLAHMAAGILHLIERLQSVAERIDSGSYREMIEALGLTMVDSKELEKVAGSIRACCKIGYLELAQVCSHWEAEEQVFKAH